MEDIMHNEQEKLIKFKELFIERFGEEIRFRKKVKDGFASNRYKKTSYIMEATDVASAITSLIPIFGTFAAPIPAAIDLFIKAYHGYKDYQQDKQTKQILESSENSSGLDYYLSLKDYMDRIINEVAIEIVRIYEYQISKLQTLKDIQKAAQYAKKLIFNSSNLQLEFTRDNVLKVLYMEAKKVNKFKMIKFTDQVHTSIQEFPKWKLSSMFYRPGIRKDVENQDSPYQFYSIQNKKGKKISRQDKYGYRGEYLSLQVTDQNGNELAFQDRHEYISMPEIDTTGLQLIPKSEDISSKYKPIHRVIYKGDIEHFQANDDNKTLRDYIKFYYGLNNLEKIVYRSSSLANSKLAGKNIDYTDFARADFQDSEFCIINDKELKSEDLPDQEGSAQNSIFIGCNFRNAKMSKIDLRDSDLSFTNIRNANLMDAKISKAKLLYADVDHANLTGIFSFSAEVKCLLINLQTAIVDDNEREKILHQNLLSTQINIESLKKQFENDYKILQELEMAQKRINAEIRIIQTQLSEHSIIINGHNNRINAIEINEEYRNRHKVSAIKLKQQYKEKILAKDLHYIESRIIDQSLPDIPVALSDIFIQKSLIYGSAGIGKSTLMRYLEHAHYRTSINNNIFIFYIDLNEIMVHHKNAEDIKIYIKLQIAKILNKTTNDVEEAIETILSDTNNVVLLLDGYDEVKNNPDINTCITDTLHKFPKIIMTSRSSIREIPNMIQQEFNKTYENFGFEDKDIIQYIDSRFKDSKTNKVLKDFLKNHPDVKEICYIPLNLYILCEIWDNSNIQQFYITSSSIYFEFIKHKIKMLPLNKQSKFYANCIELVILEKIAFQCCIDGKKSFSKELVTLIIEETPALENKKLNKLEKNILANGLLKENHDGSCIFFHEIFKEYLAASYLIRLCESKKNEAQKIEQQFLQNLQKLEINYNNIIVFLDNILKQKDLHIPTLENIMHDIITRWQQEGDKSFEENRYRNALEYYSNLVRIRPKNALFWNIKGKILIRLGRHEEAIFCYDQAIEYDPSEMVYKENKYYACICLKQYDKALEGYLSLIKNNNQIDVKRLAKYYSGAADALFHLEQYDQAYEYCQKAIVYNKENFWAHNGLGNYHFIKGNYENAVDEYKKAYQYDRFYSNTFIFKQAVILKQCLAQDQEANLLFRQAIEQGKNVENQRYQDISTLAKYFLNNKIEKEIKLSHQELTDEAVTILMICLRKLDIHTIDLSNNNISDVGAKDILQTIQANANIRKVKLDGNKIYNQEIRQEIQNILLNRNDTVLNPFISVQSTYIQEPLYTERYNKDARVIHSPSSSGRTL